MPETCEEAVIHPTTKRAWSLFLLAFVSIAAVHWLYYCHAPEQWPLWTPLVSFILLVPALLAWLDTRRCRLVLQGGELRLEPGLFRKGARSIDLRLVETVRVERGLLDRLWNTGDLVVETGHADARLVMPDIDAPGRWAKRVSEAARTARGELMEGK